MNIQNDIKFKIGDTVFYAFCFDEKIVEAQIKGIKYTLSSNKEEKTINYSLIEKDTDASYSASESLLFSDIESARTYMINEISVKIEPLNQKIDFLNNILANIKRKVNNINSSDKTLIYKTHSFGIFEEKYFENNEQVFFVENFYSYNEDIDYLPVFYGSIDSSSISINNFDIDKFKSGSYCSIYVDGFNDSRVQPEAVFYTEYEALIYAIEIIENKILLFKNHLDKINTLVD